MGRFMGIKWVKYFKEALEHAIQKEENQINQIKGRLESKNQQIGEEQLRLERKEILQATENYKSSLIREIVEKHVVEDIDKFHSALDQSVMAIHQENMRR